MAKCKLLHSRPEHLVFKGKTSSDENADNESIQLVPAQRIHQSHIEAMEKEPMTDGTTIVEQSKVWNEWEMQLQ